MKELTTSSVSHQPYNIINWKTRYDGILRIHLVCTYRMFGIALFQACSWLEGVQAFKCNKEKNMVIAGCRAMPYRLCELVQHGCDTLSKLQVVCGCDACRWVLYSPCHGTHVNWSIISLLRSLHNYL